MMQAQYHWRAVSLYGPPPGLIPGAKRAEAHQSRLTPLALMIPAHCAISLTRNFLR
jgi:hypothetical protein